MKHKIYSVVAVDQNMGISKDGKIPWNIKEDMKYFKNLTISTKDKNKRNMVIMGRVTWESLPNLLINRRNVIITRNKDYIDKGADVVHSLQEAIELADEEIETIYVIGGAQIYLEADNVQDGVYMTIINKDYDCDIKFLMKKEFKHKPRCVGARERNGVFLLFSHSFHN